MANVRTIHADWFGGYMRCSDGQQLAYQFDHRSNLVVFDNAPTVGNFYLAVRMKETEDGPQKTQNTLSLDGPYWLVPSAFTLFPQTITFQAFCIADGGDFEKHSAKFTGAILPSIVNDDTAADTVDVGKVDIMVLRF